MAGIDLQCRSEEAPSDVAPLTRLVRWSRTDAVWFAALSPPPTPSATTPATPRGPPQATSLAKVAPSRGEAGEERMLPRWKPGVEIVSMSSTPGIQALAQRWNISIFALLKVMDR